MNMHPQRPPPAISQHLEVSTSLCRLDYSEGVFLLWNRQVQSIVASHLQEYSRIRPTLISLSGRMQKTRPKAEAGSHMFLVTHSVPYALQGLLVFGIHLDKSQHCKVIASLDAPHMSLQISGERFVFAGSL